MKKPKQGDLVVSTRAAPAMYSRYEGNPVISFMEGWLGVVRATDWSDSGAHVEFFDPATGAMQKAWTHDVQKVDWPEGLLHPSTRLCDDRWWFCGSLNRRGSFNLLRAIRILAPAYFRSLDVETLCIPGIHCHKGSCADRGLPNEVFLPHVEGEYQAFLTEIRVSNDSHTYGESHVQAI